MKDQIHLNFFEFEEMISETFWNEELKDGDYIIRVEAKKFYVFNKYGEKSGRFNKFHKFEQYDDDLGYFTTYNRAMNAIKERMEDYGVRPNIWMQRSNGLLSLMRESLEED